MKFISLLLLLFISINSNGEENSKSIDLINEYKIENINGFTILVNKKILSDENQLQQLRNELKKTDK